MKAAPPKHRAGLESKWRILLVDDHPLMRAGLGQLISRQPDLAVCAEAGDPAAAFRVLVGAQPDLLVTDITMPGRSGLDFIKDVRAQRADLKILVVSMHSEAVYAERVLRAGAQGYVMKEAGGEVLLAAIRRVLAGQTYVSEQMASAILGSLGSVPSRASASPIQGLTDREFEVFRLIGEGQTTKAIANQLGLSPKTVDVHKTNLRAKLRLADSMALATHAIRWVEGSVRPG